LTLRFPAPTMQPESSDGFASVGTILPEEGAALLPGGSFRFCGFSEQRQSALGANRPDLVTVGASLTTNVFPATRECGRLDWPKRVGGRV
jgi:hypothetical protein